MTDTAAKKKNKKKKKKYLRIYLSLVNLTPGSFVLTAWLNWSIWKRMPDLNFKTNIRTFHIEEYDRMT